MATIPVVDFCEWSLDKEQVDLGQRTVQETATEVCDAFKSVGFVYLKNYGIAQQQIDDVHVIAKEFFSLPESVKTKYKRTGNNSNHGWFGYEQERLNPAKPFDLKEAFNYTPVESQVWPEAEVPDFKKRVHTLTGSCELLTERLLTAMAMGLGLESSHFAENHSNTKPNVTTLRCLYYPAIPPDFVLQKDQMRCGEHSDFGSLTLLFQDMVGGLEVCHPNGTWMAATPIADTVLVNMGDLMQRWTADKFIATPHRVLVSPQTRNGGDERQSIAYFVNPAESCVVTPIDGSNKYPPITVLDYLTYKINKTH